MLHAPDEMIVEKSPVWDLIIQNREKFYTKNLKAFVGYARRQAAKYGIKGSRLNDAQRVLDFLRQPVIKEAHAKLFLYWDDLPTGEHIFKHPPNENGERMYEVCGRKIGENTANPALIDIKHTATLGFIFNDVLRLFLGTDEE